MTLIYELTCLSSSIMCRYFIEVSTGNPARGMVPCALWEFLLTFLLLVYMATIASAIKSGALERYALPPWEVRPPLRPLYVAPGFFDWVDAKGELTDEEYSIGGRTRLEHLELMFCDFRCAEKPSGVDLHRVMPTKERVWKMQPPGLRILGWFCERKVFVAINGDLSEATHSQKSLLAKLRGDVIAFAKTHALTTTMLAGDHRAVL